ncbi:MAG: glycosyltransferase family 39 protein [Candidatus Melainabacteria bacterium]|nr:glycosyltransferase family 39 protein [Candidatus Melainabacteria bacterium]
MKSNLLMLVAIMALGLGLRLLLINGGIDLDESVTEYVSSSQTVSELIDRIVHFEFGPPLYFFLMMLWRKLTPDQAIYLALPSLFFGMLLIPLTYLLAKKITDSSKVALVAALFCSISPLALFYSHEARVYSLFSCLNASAAYFYIDWFKNKKITSLVSFSCLICFIAYTHYLGFFFLGLLGLAGLFFSLVQKQTKDFFKTIPLFFLPAALFIPWLPNMSLHLSAGTYWVERTPFSQWWQVIASNTAALTPVPWVLGAFLSIPLLIVIFFVWLKKKIELDKSNIAFLLAILIPPVFLLGYITPFILGYCRYMMPFAPFGFVLWAILITNKMKTKTMLALLVVLGLCNAFEARSLGSLDRSGLRQLAHDMNDKKFGQCLYLILPDFDTYTLRYYLRTEAKNNSDYQLVSFPNLDMQHPTPHHGYAATWTDKDNVQKLFDFLQQSSQKNLVVIRDPAVLESSKMPAKSRIDQVMKRLASTYERTGDIIEYKAKGRSFFVERFDLSSNK